MLIVICNAMTYRIRLLFVLLLMSGLTPVKAHPIKMSYSKISLADDGTIKLQIKIFKDDLENHIATKINV